jgi:signal transduction histidine kinase
VGISYEKDPFPMKRKPQREDGHSNIAGFNHRQAGSKASESGGEKDMKKPSMEAWIDELMEENKVLREEIAERRTAEEALLKTAMEKEIQIRSMAFHHTISEERSRRRLSSYLHSNVCQSLGITKMKLDSLVKSTSSSDSRASLEEVTQIIQSAIEDVRSVIANLSPAVLHELGLEAGLEWLSGQFHEQNDIPCSFENDPYSKPMKGKAGILLFYSVRDLLMNVTNHARAGDVKIHTSRTNDQLHIVVEDDGVGFTPSDNGVSFQDEGKFGLFCIRERMNSIGGSMEIVSAKGKGTRVTLVAPRQP